jgi:predicted transposase YbfD/YdcC
LRLKPGMNEITAALKLIRELDLEGAILTGDAIFCQKSVSRAVLGAKADYAFPVKDNQPELKADIAAAFAEPSSPLRRDHPAA